MKANSLLRQFVLPVQDTLGQNKNFTWEPENKVAPNFSTESASPTTEYGTEAESLD